MEHLWSPAGAAGCNRWQMGRPHSPLKQADPQPVATHWRSKRATSSCNSRVRARAPTSRLSRPVEQPRRADLPDEGRAVYDSVLRRHHPDALRAMESLEARIYGKPKETVVPDDASG